MDGKIWERIALLQEGRPLAALCRDAGLGNYQKLKKSAQRKTSPDTESLAKIAAFFRADLVWLISGKNSASKLNQKIARKLRQLRKQCGWSLEKLAEKLGLTSTVLKFYEKGRWTIPLDLINDLAKTLEVPPHFLLQEEDIQPVRVPELKIFQTATTQHTHKIHEEDYVSIPLTESSIAAGEPIIQDNSIEDYVVLHIRAAGKRTNLVATRVDGESMEPMLHSGDIVVIDRDDKKLVKNRIYAVFFDDGLTAKYIERQRGLLILRPINPNFQVQILNLYEHPDPIVGRIIGAWKEL